MERESPSQALVGDAK